MKTLITFCGKDHRHDHHILVEMTLARAVEAASTVVPADLPVYDPGELAVHFIQHVGKRALPRLLNESEREQTEVNYWVVVYHTQGQVKTQVFFHENGQFTQKFGGVLTEARTWAQVCQYEGKTVTFTYEGGSSPGQKRTVAAFKAGSYAKGYVEGVDVCKLELGRSNGQTVVTGGFRRYSVEKIKGEIRLVK